MPGKLDKMNMPEKKASKPSDAEFDAEFDMGADNEMPPPEEEVAVEDDLTTISDEALMAEIKKRGLSSEMGMGEGEDMAEGEMEDEEADFEMSEDDMGMAFPEGEEDKKYAEKKPLRSKRMM